MDTFWKTGKLNHSSNVQFGEGGAGTFSDGKLNISLNTLYTVIYKFEEEGYISEYRVFAGKKRMRVYYRLQPSGHERLRFLINEYSKLTDAVKTVFDNIDIKEDDTNDE